MEAHVQNENTKVNAPNHKQSGVTPRKSEDGETSKTSTSPPVPGSTSDVASGNVQLSFNNATISIVTPSITITPSTAPKNEMNDWETEQKKYKDNLTSSFDKYEEQQEKLIETSYEKADGLLLTISSGILALSATFIGTLLSNKHTLKRLWELDIGWSSLGLTVTFVLVSYFASRKSLFHAVESARTHKDSCLSKDDNEVKALSEKSENHHGKRELSRMCTEVLNLLATLAFITGLGLVVVFAVTNIR